MPIQASNKKRLMYVTIGYWFMLAYIMAALVWWFISLEQQNHQMMELRLGAISPNDPNLAAKTHEVIDFNNRKHGQYVGEGLIFMLLILLGAVIVYHAIRRFIKLGQQQQNFMMAVTHELKTPIAAARLNIETLQRHQLPPAQTERLLQLTLAETERLNDLCNNILLASRFERGKVATHQEILSLTNLVNDTLRQFGNRFANSLLHTQIDPDVTVEGDPLLLHLLLSNLLENAVKYGPKNQPIAVQLQQQGKWIMLSVADLGKGIAPEERQKIFEKFYRQENEQTRKKPGTGLGLYLASRIAADHGGTIALTDNTPHGSIFTVRLPAIQKATV